MTSNDLTTCPRGEGDCPIYSELENLKHRVSELAEQVRTDALTGLYNKRHLLSALEMELERSCRSKQPTGLIMLDIDHFKVFNDTHGHVAGDKVLQHVANIIKNTIRKIDIACRYGGEEFAIILPSTPLIVADHVAERVRESINSHAIEINNEVLHISASFGVSCYDQYQTGDSEELIERADQQLYRAKKMGRNQVCVEPKGKRPQTSVSEAERLALFDPEGPSERDGD